MFESGDSIFSVVVVLEILLPLFQPPIKLVFALIKPGFYLNMLRSVGKRVSEPLFFDLEYHSGDSSSHLFRRLAA